MTISPARVSPHLIALEPWTVYGHQVGFDGPLGLATVAVPDIGVLPPTGCYRGTVRSDDGRPLPARLLIHPRSSSPGGGEDLRMDVEFIGPQLFADGSGVAIVFEALEL